MKAILGFLGFVIFIIFIVVLIARTNNRRPDLAPTPQLTEAASSDADFSFNTFGPIVAEEKHYRIVINIDRNSRSVEVYQGYNNLRVASRNLSNSEAAFSDFLSALDRSGYTDIQRTRYDTEAGICPTRNRYTFVSNQFGEDFSRWTSDCNEKGNFGGNFDIVSSLFEAQIPDYSKFISETRSATGLAL